MNDTFESMLQSLPRRELPAEWKAKILGNQTASSTTAAAVPVKAWMGASLTLTLAPPRWLAWSLAGAWALVFTLNSLTPATEVPPPSTVGAVVATRALQMQRETLQSLLVTNLSNNL
jgi:hypothetical protein